MATENTVIGENPKDTQGPPKRDVAKHLKIAYERRHALVPESLKKTPGGKIEFVEHAILKHGDPASPITSFINGESDLFLTNKLQLAHLQGCVKIAVYGGSNPEYLLAPVDGLKKLQQSTLVHGFLVGLEKMHPDLMIYPVFGLRFQSAEEHAEAVKNQGNPYYQGDMD